MLGNCHQVCVCVWGGAGEGRVEVEQRVNRDPKIGQLENCGTREVTKEWTTEDLPPFQIQ